MFATTTRLLVVDDAKAMRKIVTKICKDLGFTDILEAGNGAEGWQVVSDSNPAVGLVISDWNMPDSTGVDLLRRIRADSRYGKLPFILCTTEAEDHQVKEAILAGCDAFVVKPFTGETLQEKMKEVFKKRFG